MLEDTTNSELVKSKDPDKVVEALEKYFTPETNVVYERYAFDITNQGVNESVD